MEIFLRWGSLIQSAAEGWFSFAKCCEPSTLEVIQKSLKAPLFLPLTQILVTLADDDGVQLQANKRTIAPVQAERLPRRIGTSPISRRFTSYSFGISSPLRHIGTNSHLALRGRTMFVNRHNKGRSCSSVEFEAPDKTKGPTSAHILSAILEIVGCRSVR